jgi:hypothetical protein
MPINKPKTNKTINQEGIIYALIFVFYIIILGIIFTYAIQFVRGSINTALGTPTNPAIESKYGQLDLANYALVADKLGLKKSNPIVITAPIETTAPIIATSAPIVVTSTPIQVSTTSLPTTPMVTASATPIIATNTPIIPTEKRPTIVITNSTGKSGLAADLKNRLIAAGYQIIGTGNSNPSLATTTILVKNSISPDSKFLTEIKKIVSANYVFVVLPLNDKAASDIEVIIGNK